MKYRLYPTQIIHWPEEDISKNDFANGRIMGVITAEIYAVNEGRLPIIIEAQVRFASDGVDVFSCILHTKALLTFDFNENPINDLVKMLYEAEEQEKTLWKQRSYTTALSQIDIDKAESDPNVKLNKACEIRDAAKARNLLA